MSLIIGGSATPAPTQGLPEPEVDLPHPGTAPEAHHIMSTERIVALLGHSNPLVRTFAIEQASLRSEPEVLDALAARVREGDDLVAIEAIGVLEAKKYRPAADALLERFATAHGELAAVCATALGQLAPERLLDAVKARGRLDDEAFAAVATALGIVGSDDTVAFLDKGLNRAGAVSPDRRGALYGAALLSGSEKL
ncbi:MAG: hypothetical protein KC933_38070, partial [Myxococcales bacterium]|nr:hypothetical protein [Myxococcales bacterium]